MRSTLLAATAMLMIAGTAQAEGPALPSTPPGSRDPSKVEAGTYAIEPSHTRVAFTVDHMGFSDWFGGFVNVSGTLTLDPKHPASSTVEITVPIDSVGTTNAKLDGELKDADWLDAAKFPTATFKSNGVHPTGKDTADITGDLTLHGVTKKVTLKTRLHGAGTNPFSKKASVGFDATTTIKRSEFGVAKYIPLVGDEVTLTIAAAFEKAS